MNITVTLPPSIAAGEEPGRILLHPDMVFSDLHVMTLRDMLDEQEQTGFGTAYPDPLTHQDEKIEFATQLQPWQGGEGIIDLGAEYMITDILLYDTNGYEDPYTFSVGKTVWGDFTELFTIYMDGYYVWQHRAVSTEARYLKIRCTGGTAIAEMALYGYKLPSQPGGGAPVTVSGNTVGQLIGHNALLNSTPVEINIGGILREYHEWEWDYSGDPGALQFETSRMGVNMDEFYGAISRNGMDILYCLMNSSPPYSDGKGKPLDPQGDPANPLNYSGHAARLFQVAARYGGNAAVDTALLTLAPGEQPKTGLGYIGYFEGYNEPDSTWGANAPDVLFTPEQLAVMMSADYDGHEGRLGNGYGVKTADPNATVVMPGLASIDFQYVDRMSAWFKANRSDERFAADALNFHHYTFGGDAGNSPEEAGLRRWFEEIVAYRDAKLPGLEVWITEFGWDTHPDSRIAARAHDGYSIEEVQGQWLVRGYLAAAAAGVDRAVMYMLGDVDPYDPTQYATSGLITIDGALKPS
jgi:hypothetical protein